MAWKIEPRKALRIAALCLAALSAGGWTAAGNAAPGTEVKSDMSDLTNIVLMRAKPGKSEALGAHLRDLIGHTRKEAGAVIVELHQSPTEPNLWMVYERWKDKAALDDHMTKPYVKDFLGSMDELLDGAPSVEQFLHRKI